MSDELTPKELARIKMLARERRIGTIRKRVAVLGVTLAALFSGAILARSQIDQFGAGGAAGAAPTALISGSTDRSGSDDAGESGEDGAGPLSAVTGAIGGLVGGGGSSTGSSSQPAQSAPLVTSQS